MSHPEWSNVMLLTCMHVNVWPEVTRKPSRFACAQTQAVRLFVCPEGVLLPEQLFSAADNIESDDCWLRMSCLNA